jgi:tRNA 2-thiouridine synthesizing protein D
MADRKTLTFAIMDAPYESARSTTAFRLIDLAIRRGFNVNVFAYEGAVSLAFARQAPHPNAVHGRDVAQENHPNPKDWVAALLAEAARRGAKLDWVQCGLCVDERGVGESVAGTRRGTPADLWKFVEESDNSMVIPTK